MVVVGAAASVFGCSAPLTGKGAREPWQLSWVSRVREHAWEVWREGVHLPFIGLCPLRQPLYPLRILVANDEQPAKASIKAWKKAPLLKTSLTEPAEMLASKDMVSVENVRDEALPAATSTDQNQSQTERHCQIGVDAALKLLGSLVSGTMPEGVAAFAVVDLSPRTGDFGLAVLNLLSQAASPLHYFYCAEDEEHTEWLKWWLVHNTTESILAGQLQPMGFHLPPEEPPADECAGLPPKPTLSVLVWESRQGMSSEVHIPADVMTKWSGSPDWAGSMKVLTNRVMAAGRDPVCSPPPATRARTDGPETPIKAEPGTELAEKEEPVVVADVPVTEVPTLAHEVRFQAARFHDLWLCVAAPAAVGGDLFIANRSDADIELPSGSLVAGFYQGKWFHRSGDDSTDPTKDVPFILSHADDLVLVGGIVMTLGQALDKTPQPEGPVPHHGAGPVARRTWPLQADRQT